MAMPGWLATSIALASAALMGLAIQRGATCMVAAVGEIVTERKATRALALGEAALWVAGGLALASLLNILPSPPTGFAAGAGAATGGFLLGLGALINRACVFGAIARLGSGEWAYAATPLGFYLGCLLLDRTWPAASHGAALASPLVSFALPVAAGFSLLIAWRGVQTLSTADRLAHLWHPHRATLLIGATFVATLLTAGAWSYTHALAQLARMMDARLPLRLAMFLALLAGAIGGGWIAGVLRPVMPSPRAVLRCLAGGALMGIGGQLAPGSNDGLILIGLPLLLPHAWAAIAAMIAAIAIPMLAGRRYAALRNRSR